MRNPRRPPAINLGSFGLQIGSQGVSVRPQQGVSAAPPVNTVAPVVSGTAEIGQTLSTTDGTWTGDPTIVFTYQWKRAGANIGGATASTYLLAAADNAQSITCAVTGTNAVGSASAVSNAVVAGLPVNTVAPVIAITAGSGYVGSTYTRTAGTWSSGVATGQWRADGVAIAGETGATYTMTLAREGQAITYRETNNGATADSNAIEMWVLSDLPAGSIALDLRQGVTLNGADVARIDAILGGVNAAQATGANQPLFEAAGFGAGYPSVYADASATDRLTLSAGSYAQLNRGETNNNLQWALGTTIATPNASFPKNVTKLFSGRAALSDCKMYSGGLEVVSSTSALIVTVQSFVVLIHATGTGGSLNGRIVDAAVLLNRSLGDRVLNGRVGALALATVTWSDSDRQKAEGCVAHQFGTTAALDATQPYKTLAPRVQ